MKKIKIRFIKRDKNVYTIQKRVLFWWKYITFDVGGYSGYVKFIYCESSKDELLEKVLDEHFKVSKKNVSIIEYPMLKIY